MTTVLSRNKAYGGRCLIGSGRVWFQLTDRGHFPASDTASILAAIMGSRTEQRSQIHGLRKHFQRELNKQGTLLMNKIEANANAVGQLREDVVELEAVAQAVPKAGVRLIAPS